MSEHLARLVPLRFPFAKVVALVVLVALFGFSLLPLRASLHVDTSYDGRYRGHPAFDKVLADIPFVYQESLEKLRKSLGLKTPEKINIVVIFSDHLTHNGVRLRGKRRSVRGSTGKIIHYIYLDLEFLMNGQATLLEEMAHELTHAVMAEQMGLERYDRLPMWIKEGTAVHAADQGLARIKALLKRGYNLARLGNEDEGDDGNPISLEKYVENYLKIQFLLKTYGQSALHTFISAIMRSGQVDHELAASFNGLNEETLNHYCRDFIARQLTANARPVQAQEHLAHGIRFFEAGEFLSARLALTEALDAGLVDRDFQKAAYLLAECFIQERNPEIAFTILQRVRPNPADIPMDRYAFLQAYTQYAMGMTTASYEGFRNALNISTTPAVKEGALYYIIRILLEIGKRPEADRVLGYFQQQFPQSGYIPLARQAFANLP
ncbi:MAG: hypothetical protein A2286_10075 [Gammaproteobacteria bacterium RIFOXYA12_FULL_61_12]|nr:MAG: hypothetical protein A2286_10075 [Gammaproteobacteria bacterium RIFOXYA12_FULL_61_12]